MDLLLQLLALCFGQDAVKIPREEKEADGADPRPSQRPAASQSRMEVENSIVLAGALLPENLHSNCSLAFAVLELNNPVLPNGSFEIFRIELQRSLRASCCVFLLLAFFLALLVSTSCCLRSFCWEVVVDAQVRRFGEERGLLCLLK